jgi:phosphoribosyl-AMP cyclohydrolase / phosphoribosyl-ATP pyrophosphohydrolase
VIPLERRDAIAWAKLNGLLPAIVQHHADARVLMLGYMNEAALAQTLSAGTVTFFSRSKQRLWTKGESSGNVLKVVSLALDCDDDTLLIQADPIGPTCHRGTDTCFDAFDAEPSSLAFLRTLETLISDRQRERPSGSYTTKLFDSGIRRIAQKVGEEGLETALAAVVQNDDELTGEAADLVFHLLVLLRARGVGLETVLAELKNRHAAPASSG